MLQRSGPPMRAAVCADSDSPRQEPSIGANSADECPPYPLIFDRELDANSFKSQALGPDEYLYHTTFCYSALICQVRKCDEPHAVGFRNFDPTTSVHASPLLL